MIDLQLQRLTDGARIPTYATGGAGCFDLYSAGDLNVRPGRVTKVPLGIRVRVPDGYILEILTRSGMAAKGVFVANSPGQVDSDYRGEVCVLLYNSTEGGFIIQTGDRVAQGRLVPIPRVNFQEVERIDVHETQRGEGGFGSTGIK